MGGEGERGGERSMLALDSRVKLRQRGGRNSVWEAMRVHREEHGAAPACVAYNPVSISFSAALRVRQMY